MKIRRTKAAPTVKSSRLTTIAKGIPMSSFPDTTHPPRGMTPWGRRQRNTTFLRSVQLWFFSNCQQERERDVTAAHLGMDVEVPVGLEASLLILCVVEQEAVLDDEESLYRGRQRKRPWANPEVLEGTQTCRCSQTENWTGAFLPANQRFLRLFTIENRELLFQLNL